MSSIDLGNPQVLKNFIKSQMKEGKGNVYLKENVKVFKDKSGNEFVVPNDMNVKAEAVKKEYSEEVINEALKNEENVGSEKPMDDIGELRAAYVEKYDKSVPNRYVNDADWLKSKI